MKQEKTTKADPGQRSPEHQEDRESNTHIDPIEPTDDVGTDSQSESTGEDLKYNAEDDTFELDTATEDQEYQHPLPYDTTAPGGEDDNSTYDEENQYTPNEYRDTRSEMDGKLEELDAVKESLDELPDDTLDSDNLDLEDEASDF